MLMTTPVQFNRSYHFDKTYYLYDGYKNSDAKS